MDFFLILVTGILFVRKMRITVIYGFELPNPYFPFLADFKFVYTVCLEIAYFLPYYTHTHTQSRRLLLFCRCLHSRVTDAQTLQFNTHHTTYTVQNHTLESQRSEIFSLKNHYFVKQPLMWMLPDHYRHNLFMSLGYPHVAYRG